jgi:hypothetical protein
MQIPKRELLSTSVWMEEIVRMYYGLTHAGDLSVARSYEGLWAVKNLNCTMIRTQSH